MAADQFGRRYIKQGDFIGYAKDLDLRDSFLAHILEFAERFCIVTPAARVRFPDAVVRRWFRDQYPTAQVLEPVEPDGARMSAANDLSNALANVQLRRTELPGVGDHPLDLLAPEYRPFVTKEFSRSTFTPWSTFRTPLSIHNGTELGGNDGVETYYHAWQVFQLAAFLRSGMSVLYDVGSDRTWDQLLDLRRDDVYMVANFDARRELKMLHDNAAFFDAVARSDDGRNRALQVHATGVDRRTGRLSTSASRAYRSREAEIARQVLAKAKLSPKALISFIHLQCGLWTDGGSRHPAPIVDAYKRNIQSTIELLRLSSPRYTVSSIFKRVGTSGGFRQRLLETIFPDWVSEQRQVVEASLQQWIVPRLVQMPPQFSFAGTDAAHFCKWIERKGFLQLYWHFRRLVDIGPFDDQIGRTAATVEIIGLASLIEQLATQALADRQPQVLIRGTLHPKLMALLRPKSALAVELNKEWSLTNTKQRTLRQQLLRIARRPVLGPNAPALKALLRLVLIRNAASHGGLPGFKRDEMQTLIESLLIAALVVWKAR